MVPTVNLSEGGGVTIICRVVLCGHLALVVLPRREFVPCPNRWHLKQRRGFGMYGPVENCMKHALTDSGSIEQSNVKIKYFIQISVSFGRMVILRTPVTPWSRRPPSRSVPVSFIRSGSEMTP